MSVKLLTAPEREGRTFGIAIRILGILAVVLLALSSWAILVRFSGEKREPAGASYGSGLGSGYTSGYVPGLSSPGPMLEPLDAVVVAPGTIVTGADPGIGASPTPLLPSQPAAVSSTPATPGTPLPPPVEVAEEHPAHHIGDAAARTLVEKGLQLREEGDTQGALAALKEARGLVSEHPKILAELATTYHQVGQSEKAATFWVSVHQMGPSRAGAYWDLADMALKGELLDDSRSINDYLRVARHTARAANAPDEKGQRVILRVHIEALAEEEISGEHMYLQVYFYDIVNESRFEQTIADTSPRYVTAPYDWRGGEEEVIEVEYFLPELTAEQRAGLGSRQYFGYVIELYYRDILQDLVATPRKLARFGSAGPPPSGHEP